MPAQYYAAPNRLLFKVLCVGGRVAVAVDAATYLHSKNFEVVADVPFAICLGVNMALDCALHIVFSLVASCPAFAVYVLNAVVLYAVAPIPACTQHLVVVLYPFLRDGRAERLAHYKPVVVAYDNVSDGERFRPFANVFYGFVKFVRTAQRIWVGFVVAAVMVVEDVANENNVIAVKPLVLLNAKFEITVEFERAMQITYNQDAPFIRPDEVQGFDLLRA